MKGKFVTEMSKESHSSSPQVSDVPNFTSQGCYHQLLKIPLEQKIYQTSGEKKMT